MFFRLSNYKKINMKFWQILDESKGILQYQLEGSSISILDLLKIGAENHYPFVNLVEHLSLVLFDLLTN